MMVNAPLTLVGEVARVAHEVNRAYCQSIGDDSQLPWEEAPDWQRASSIKGVAGIVDGSITGPGDSHRSWMAEKLADGWVFGPVKDPERKEHPCMVPFEQLELVQQVKDHLFFGVVTAIITSPGGTQ